MKKVIALLITLCLIASLGLVPAAAEDTHPDGDPWFNSDIYGLWPSERPALEDQYELWANYDFYREVMEKGENTSLNSFDLTTARVMDQLLEYCGTNENSDAESECLRILYDFNKDQETIEKEGFASLMAYVERVKGVQSLDELTALFQEEGFLFGSPFFDIRLNQFQDNEKTLYGISISKTPAVEEQWPTEEELAVNPAAMPVKDTEKVRRRLLHMQYSEEETERLLEKIIWFDSFYPYEYTTSEREDELAGKPALSLADIRELCPPLAAMLKGMGWTREGGEQTAFYQVMIEDLAAFREAYTEGNLDLFKAEIVLSMYAAGERILGRAAFPEAVEYTDPGSFLRLAPVALYSQAYVHHLIPQERIEIYYQLVDEIREAMRVRIGQSSWISPETKEKAFEKLDKIVPASIVYAWESDFEPLRTALHSCKNLLEAEAQCILSTRKEDMRYAGMETFRGNRKMSTEMPLSASGLYYPWENAIYIGAGTLTDGLYNGASRETILASLGCTIGHELSHGFDTNGMLYDADGSQNPIWTEEDQQTYMERANAVADRASRIILLDDVHVPGRQQISEIIADTEGLRLVLDLAKKEEHFDYDAFFRACAQFYNWYYESRETYAQQFGVIEVHPAPMVRVNFTLQLMDEFYETYPSVTEGTPMYLPPEERELVW